MDPEELQEIGLFLLLGIIWAMLVRPSLGEYEDIINYALIALFAAGVFLVAYGFLLMRSTSKLVREGRNLRKEE
jgi:hypothetical protein